jgi:hypothetical protein
MGSILVGICVSFHFILMTLLTKRVNLENSVDLAVIWIEMRGIR